VDISSVRLVDASSRMSISRNRLEEEATEAALLGEFVKGVTAERAADQKALILRSRSSQ
jgi:hypothetical protein